MLVNLTSNFNTTKMKIKNIAVTTIIVALAVLAYYVSDNVLYLFGPKSAANKALSFLKNSGKSSQSAFDIFETQYFVDIVAKYPYYNIENWKLKSTNIDAKNAIILAEGTRTNGLGITSDIAVILMAKRSIIDDHWQISDSDGLFVIDEFPSSISANSDKEKVAILAEIRDKVKIETWTFHYHSYGTKKGIATIMNNSKYPVNNVMINIQYKDIDGNVVNTDETYAIGSTPLQPGDRKIVDWYTSNCYDCHSGNAELIFK